ncbi:MAG: hypothetical protein GXY22_09445 [Clostridiaceae bacterium]|jgi:hypothetical protein|nr:hypothetical protein [Eubacteriales bacterium]NLV48863.1 hypothetical protein [Clostridiaceae bacterium]
MSEHAVYCPLLKKDIRRSVCQKITYAAEGRISHAVVPEIEDWTNAKNVCADCVNAYWNKNNMQIDV